MTTILPEVIGLLQHIKKLEEDINFYRPKCSYCGMSNPWVHGYYYRKSDRCNKGTASLNPVPIPRFFCKHCKKTASVLPECIAPRRWYMWDIQQAVLLQVLLGKSLRRVSEVTSISRSTCRRWRDRLKIRYLLHGSVLCSYYSDLGRHAGFYDFWRACLYKISLSKAMLLCNKSGVIIP